MIVCLCYEADWVLPEIADHCLHILEEAGVAHTYFSTEDQRVRCSAIRDVALLPDMGVADPVGHVISMARLYHCARGIRPFGLDWGPGLPAGLLASLEINWTSARHGQDCLPAPMLEGLPDASITWDDSQWLEGRVAPDLERMASREPGIFMLNFRPLHVYLNTSGPGHFERAKPHLRNLEALSALRNSSEMGVHDILDSVLARLGEPGVRFLTVGRALERFQPQEDEDD